MLYSRREFAKRCCVFGGLTLAIALPRVGRSADPPTTKDFAQAQPESTADVAQMNAWWEDLEKDEMEATRAILKLSTWPNEAVAFLARRMKPLKIDAERVKDLLEMLKGDDEVSWKPAFEYLEYFDPRLAIDLQELMTEVTDIRARRRMVEVMSGRLPGSLEGKQISLRGVRGEGFNFVSTPGGSWWAEHKVSRINTLGWVNLKKKWTRAVRAIVLLEHVGTPDAIAVLKAMATGHPEAQPTKAAKEALERVSGKAR